MGFRPEHYLPLESSVTENALTMIPLHVAHVENLGADRLVYGNLENAYEGKLISAKLPSIVSAVVEPGETYDFVIETRHLKFFDKATGIKTEAIPI